VGIWRGIEAQKGFILGEWDYNFTANSVTIKDPMGTITHGTVSIVNNMIITLIDGPHSGSKINVLTVEMANGPETTTMGFGLSDYDSPAPSTIADAFDGTSNARVHVLSKCNSWKASCDFSAAFNTFRSSIPSMYQPYMSSPGWLEGASGMFRKRPATNVPVVAIRRGVPQIQHDPDPCNRFLTCSACVGQREGQFQCGWCMGGTIVYNDTGDSGLHCAGFIASQPALPFYCPLDFRTEDCTGYSCNYTSSQPQCQVTSDGTYSSQTQCEETCKSAQFARCNQETKQCEACAQGEPDCQYTKEECQQSCGLQLQRCNYTTHQCENCNKLTDPNCTKSAGECSYDCSHDQHGVCNPTTGQCQQCDPTKGQPGCVDQCSATCTRSLNFMCDNTTQQCVPGQGNMTLQACAQACQNHTTATYGCDWTNATSPQCVAGKGTQTLSQCAENCHTVQFAKCDPVTGSCQSCTQGSDPSCQYTADYCKASCQKSNLMGIWRGIQINKGFKVAEFDFTFYPDGKVTFVSTANSSAVYEALFTEGGVTSEGRPVIFVITVAPTQGPLPIQMNNNLRGLFTVNDGEQGITRFMYLGLGFNLVPATTFDDAMSKMEFVLISCKTATHCDFTAAKVPEI